ncbi:hypothetical protein D1007_35423 [Hordeum vulgare]|nr:hypothetical protein D1007_35423 [Hordeum vulgare]
MDGWVLQQDGSGKQLAMKRAGTYNLQVGLGEQSLAEEALLIRSSGIGHIDGTERNRASPQAICKLYKHINEDQRAAIKDMGTGAFLDIKCGYLHNTFVTWFTRQYHSGRKGDGSRPKITTVVTAIINNNNGDASFKKLWLIYIVSTVLAPTTDTRISNKCYPMLEHIDQANGLNLCKFVVAQLHEHLSKGKFTKGCLLYCMDKLKATTVISKFASGVGTLFNQFASGVDTLLTELVQGLTAPATRNTTTSRIRRGTEERESDDTSSEDSVESDNDTNEDNVDIERDKKKRVTREEDITRGNVESPLTKNAIDVAGEMENTAYDPSQGANFFGGARETEVCDNTSSGDPSAQFDTKSPSRSTSHLNLPSDSDMCSPDNNSPADTLVSLISEGNSQELEEKIRGSAQQGLLTGCVS